MKRWWVGIFKFISTITAYNVREGSMQQGRLDWQFAPLSLFVCACTQMIAKCDRQTKDEDIQHFFSKNRKCNDVEGVLLATERWTKTK